MPQAIAASHLTTGATSSTSDLVRDIVANLPDAPPDESELKKDVTRMLTEVSSMNEALMAIVNTMLDDSDSKTFGFLEAMKACLQRMELSTDDIDTRTFRAGWNGL